jgi:putative beta-lysine N-acetyltransferase
MSDHVEKLGKSHIQHGPLNDRIYLMKLHADDFPGILSDIDELAHGNGYSKVFAKVPAEYSPRFQQFGYQQEAMIPGFYNNMGDAAFLSRYFTDARRIDANAEQAREVLVQAEENRGKGLPEDKIPPLQIYMAGSNEVEEMSQVYREVFRSYPFPIHDPEYILETMESHVRYFCIRKMNKIVSLSSAEIDSECQNAEMTDFATLPEYRGEGFGSFLLLRMENEMKNLRISTLYTIARALSPGMNIVFSRMDYIFAGSLINNTNISGNVESMNVWYKHLQPRH